MKSLLIYKNNYNTNFDKYNPILYNKKIYLLYDGKVINPPFFDLIIIDHYDLSNDDLKMIYNMIIINGSIIYLDKYNYFFKNGIKYDSNFNQVKKKKNNIFIFNSRRIIEFIIMGAQKSGTTALSHNISKHPDIYIDSNPDPFKSEIHFFDIYFNKGIEWYKKHFNYKKKVVGEKTPDLMYLDYTFPYIQSINPYIKIIIILRNPIERAYSSWKFTKKYFNEQRTFEEAINYELEFGETQNKTFYTAEIHYLQRGLYYKQIKNLLKWFNKDNLLILINEEVKENMIIEYNRVYNFLNLNSFTTKYEIIFESEKSNKDINKKLNNKLIKYFKKDVRHLEKFLNKKLNWL
jgi:hypothetical protein